MSDLLTQLQEYGHQLDETAAPLTVPSQRSMVGQPRQRASWRGPLVAVGTAVAILVVVAAATLILQVGSADVDEVPVVDQPEPVVTTPTGPFVPVPLVPTEGAAWSVLGAHHAVVYVDSVDKVVMFGGHTGDYGSDFRPNDQTLVVDLETQIAERLDTPGPPPRSHHAMVYDRQSDRVILFGGNPPGEYSREGSFYQDAYSDTWAFDPATGTWEEMNPAHSPPPSSFHDLVYHPASDRVVFVGGEVWTYDYESDTWDMRSTAGPPWHGYIPGGAVVDEASGLIVAVSAPCDSVCGFSTRSFDLDTNQWDVNPGAPFLHSEPRVDGETLTSAVFEPSTQRIIGYGRQRIIGYEREDGTGVVFVYSPESGTWAHHGYGPELGDRSPTVYDPARSQLIVFPATLDASQTEWQIWTAPSRSLGDEPLAP